MIYDIMPGWVRRVLKMDTAILPAEKWTWRHTCRYGRNPAKTLDDFAQYVPPKRHQ